MAQAHILKFLLCIAISKDGSIVYQMFQQKNHLKAFFIALPFLAPSQKKKDQLMMMGVRLCDYTANAQISMLQLILCVIVCFHSKCK